MKKCPICGTNVEIYGEVILTKNGVTVIQCGRCSEQIIFRSDKHLMPFEKREGS